MHCVLWSYPSPAGLTKQKADKLFLDVADMYVGVPGLIRKHFGSSEDGATIVGIHLWRSKAEADAFYSPEWVSGVVSRWGVIPDRSEWRVPQVVESEEARIVSDDAPRAEAAE